MMAFCNIVTHGRGARVSRLLYNFLHTSRTALSRDLFALQISEASMIIPEETQYPNSSRNKHLYILYKHDLSHLVIGLHSDAVSGLLKLASFFYVHKQYLASLTVITDALQKFTDEKIHERAFDYRNTFDNIQKHGLNLMKKEKLHTIIKSLTIHPFLFEVHSSIIPQELQQDVTKMPIFFSYVSICTFPFRAMLLPST
ncbi:unnamed protein product [Mytilus coruscus]|uniref:Uncharacterized protein n=1 Tax=Mytilus coruscus TaxID=42192 RepID=A0A6J8AR61_MYTCO|nr:unnamed protein product [Mytilus coruscus]